MKVFCTFVIDSLEFTVTSYAEIFGYETAGLFVAVNCDENQTVAFYAASNISVIVWIISSAISTVCRTRINLMIGLKKYDTAKNFYYFYITLIALLGVLFGILVFFSRDFLSWLVANSTPEMKHWFTIIMTIYAFEILQ